MKRRIINPRMYSGGGEDNFGSNSPDVIGKVASGNMGQLGLRDGMQAGQMVSGFIPGGTVIGGGLQYLEDGFGIDDEKRALQEVGIDLKRTYSRAARRKMQSLEARPTTNLLKYGVQAGAGVGGWFAGAAVGSAILPFGGTMIGGIAGSLGAGYVAGRIYEGNFESTEQDAVNLAANCYRKRCQNGAISEEEALANLVAALPERAQRRYEDYLEKKAGTRDFSQATQTEQGMNALRSMMSDPNLEYTLRAHTHIPCNPNNPNQHICSQYAEMINSGQLDARTIIMEPERIGNAAMRCYMQNAVHASAPPYANPQVMPQQQLPGQPVRSSSKGLFS